MKMAWCPETANKAYIEAAKALSGCTEEDANVAELIAALAGGWKSQLIVEASAGGATTSISLSAATRHTHGRHMCAVVGEAEDVMREVEGVDFLVVDFRRRDAARVIEEARAGDRGMVVVCTNVEGRCRGNVMVVGKGMRLLKSRYLPIGRGVEILHVGMDKGSMLGGDHGRTRWIKYVDRVTGDEYLFRR